MITVLSSCVSYYFLWVYMIKVSVLSFLLLVSIYTVFLVCEILRNNHSYFLLNDVKYNTGILCTRIFHLKNRFFLFVCGFFLNFSSFTSKKCCWEATWSPFTGAGLSRCIEDSLMELDRFLILSCYCLFDPFTVSIFHILILHTM